MNTLKTVFGKLFKEETKLASHEVALGILQDIEKEMISANQGVMKSIDLAKSALKPAQTSLQMNKELLVKLQNFTKQIKDLGITNPQVEVENGIKQVKENIKMIETLITNLHSI
jgi:hypothetical protein